MIKKVKPLIFGIQGLELTEEEKLFFKEHNPFGFILFQRNCSNPEQVIALNEQLKSCCDNPNIHILIDQEGGRVSRLKEPKFTEFPAVKSFGDIAQDNLPEAKKATFESAQIMGIMLKSLGFTINCAPMADILYPDSHSGVIGDRAFSDDKEIVIELSHAYARGLLSSGIEPVIKHLPGHGRAKLDSHYELPTIEATYEELNNTDFEVFRQLNNFQFGMTGHLLFSRIDNTQPSTFSKKIIDIIRQDIGFKGLLMTDDLSMKALQGSYAERTRKSFEAGCDLILHCNGNMDEMKEIAEATGIRS